MNRSRSAPRSTATGTNFSLFSEVATKVELVPVRRRREGDASRAAGGHGALLAWLSAGHQARPALRLPRARPVGTRSRGTGAIPTSCCWIHTRRRSTAGGSGTSRCSRITSTIPTARRTISTARPHMPKSVVVDDSVRLGRGRAAADAVAQDDRLRDARQGVHEAAPEAARARARHLRRARAIPRRSTT